MKKSLLALAVLGAYAGVASAQSSVTLYGTIDMAGTYIKNDGFSDRLSLATNGINSSQLGFRGIEDLGGGLRAGFILLGDLAPIDTGNAGGKFFGRRATVSLFTNAGELRLGRDYTPTFWNQTIFDAFGTNGVGNSLNVRQLYGGTRMDNSIGYFLPSNIGGFYGQIMTAAGEGGSTLDRPGTYLGGRFGFAAGPFDIAVAYSELEYSIPFVSVAGTGLGQLVPIAPGAKQKSANVGGSWDFGFMKLMGYYVQEKIPNAKEDMASISANIPFGQAEVRVGYDQSKLDRTGAGTFDSKINQVKATFQYNLSKRTAMYTTVSLLDNEDATRQQVFGGSSSPGPSPANVGPTAGGKSKGFQLGVRHFF